MPVDKPSRTQVHVGWLVATIMLGAAVSGLMRYQVALLQDRVASLKSNDRLRRSTHSAALTGLRTTFSRQEGMINAQKDTITFQAARLAYFDFRSELLIEDPSPDRCELPRKTKLSPLPLPRR